MLGAQVQSIAAIRDLGRLTGVCSFFFFFVFFHAYAYTWYTQSGFVFSELAPMNSGDGPRLVKRKKKEKKKNVWHL